MSQKKFPMYNKFEYQIFFLVIVCVGVPVDSDYFNIRTYFIAKWTKNYLKVKSHVSICWQLGGV